MALVKRIRYSEIRFEGVANFQWEEAGSKANALLADYNYEHSFDRLQSGLWSDKAKGGLQIPARLAGGDVHVPWYRMNGYGFWLRYEEHALKMVTGRRAWRRLTPILRQTRIVYEGELEGVASSFADVYLYPFGYSLVLTVDLTCNLPLDRIPGLVQGIRMTRGFAIHDEKSDQTWKLSELADRLMGIERGKLGFPAREVSRPHIDPFIVVSPLNGDRTEEGSASGTGTPWNALHGISTGDPNWEDRAVTEKSKRLLRSPGSPMSHAVYCSERGRAIWFPQYFNRTRQVHTISCYHRNICALSQQIEALTWFCREIAARIEARGSLGFWTPKYGRNAAGALRRLVSGGGRTYQSRSAAKHITDSDSAFLDIILKSLPP